MVESSERVGFVIVVKREFGGDEASADGEFLSQIDARKSPAAQFREEPVAQECLARFGPTDR